MKKILFISLMLISSNVFSQNIERKSFEDIWENLYDKSLKQKSIKEEREAQELTLTRSARHWLPRVYATGQWFRTSDPTQVFFNHLGQRAVTQNDFIVSDLNRPGYAQAKYGALGVDLPLFEGGSKSSQTSMYRSLVKASEKELEAKKSEEYSELGRYYGGLLLYTQGREDLLSLNTELEKIISSYQFGAKSNLVGHSGLLGLKGLKNRIEGMTFEYDLKLENSRKWINTKTENESVWLPKTEQQLLKFVQNSLSQMATQSYSTMIQAEELKVSSLDDVANIERSRFLPKVGLFAQSNLYSGPRNTSSAQTYGLYVMWDIFNADSYGRVGEANAKALSAKTKLSAFKQDEKIMFNQLYDSKVTLEKSLLLIERSRLLLQEQSQTAMKLFKSGMVSALQLSEVLNRRVDLVDNKVKVESQYLDVSSRLYQLNN